MEERSSGFFFWLFFPESIVVGRFLGSVLSVSAKLGEELDEGIEVLGF